MADRLTAQQAIDFSDLNLRHRITRTLTIDNNAIALTDITAMVDRWGSIKTEVYNKHPKERGDLTFPVTTIDVDNSSGYFDLGGTAFPNGASDLASTVLRLVVVVSGTTWIDFIGFLKEPEYMDSKILGLVFEHPLTLATSRVWRRADRIGGDTGVNRGLT